MDFLRTKTNTLLVLSPAEYFNNIFTVKLENILLRISAQQPLIQLTLKKFSIVSLGCINELRFQLYSPTSQEFFKASMKTCNALHKIAMLHDQNCYKICISSEKF